SRSEFFFFAGRSRHTSLSRDWSSDVCSSDLAMYSNQQTAPFVVLSNPTLYANGQPQFVSTAFGQGGAGLPGTITWFNNPAIRDFRFSILLANAESGLTPPDSAIPTSRAVLFSFDDSAFFGPLPPHPLVFFEGEQSPISSTGV